MKRTLNVVLSIILISTFTGTFAKERTVGLLLWDQQKSWDGYTLFPGKHVGTTVLINNHGYVMHSWNSSYEPGQSAYLLPNGNLLRCALLKTSFSIGGGEGGRFELYSWEGKMLWGFNYSTPNYSSHHDAKMLPNGDLLAMAVERKTKEECLAAGFDTTLLQEGYVAVEYLLQFRQTGDTTYQIVWEWHLWDHLIQDKYPSKNNYGVVKEHPELNDVASTTGTKIPAFWNHGNSVDYNAKFDQICVSIRGNSEFWILDHSTTTQLAAGHTGGKYGKGGDILYRWGNPQAYDRATNANRVLYQQHDAQWIPDGCPGAGNILIYNNGIDRPSPQYSTVEEVVLPCDTNGFFPTLQTNQAWTPSVPVWTYKAPNSTDFYSAEISGVQRLPNGNTLICEGLKGHLFEITPEKQIVWRYVSPLVDQDTLSQGDDPADDIDPRGHQNNAVFKVHRYGADYAGFVGRDLTPTVQLEKNPWSDLTKNQIASNKADIPSGVLIITGSRITINLPNNYPTKIAMHTVSGKLIFDKRSIYKSFTWQNNTCPSGIYIITVSNSHYYKCYSVILSDGGNI
jgi:hypothetical protein